MKHKQLYDQQKELWDRLLHDNENHIKTSGFHVVPIWNTLNSLIFTALRKELEFGIMYRLEVQIMKENLNE